jgi:hypothetical protein
MPAITGTNTPVGPLTIITMDTNRQGQLFPVPPVAD